VLWQQHPTRWKHLVREKTTGFSSAFHPLGLLLTVRLQRSLRGYLILEPDWETRTWTQANLPIGVSMYRLELPPTYFAYGTPPVEITADARTDLLKHAPAAVRVS